MAGEREGQRGDKNGNQGGVGATELDDGGGEEWEEGTGRNLSPPSILALDSNKLSSD